MKSPDRRIDASRRDRVREVEIWISNLLRTGVILSLLLVVAGTILSFVHHPSYLHSGRDLAHLTRPGAAFPHSIPDLRQSLLTFRGRGVVTLGLLVLIATPVMRVAVSILAFRHDRDRPFVLITTVVLLLLILSFVLGKAGG